jgi:hypothetical protein
MARIVMNSYMVRYPQGEKASTSTRGTHEQKQNAPTEGKSEGQQEWPSAEPGSRTLDHLDKG